MPEISILLPVRDGARTIEAAALSILNQSFSDFELILLDDGSSDDTVERVRALRDDRIKIHSDGRKLGLAPRLNQGIGLARGRLLARMDADDVSLPCRLEIQRNYLLMHPDVDLVAGRAVVFRNDAEIIGLLPFAAEHEEIMARPWRAVPLPHPTWMGRKKWFSQHLYRLPEVRRAEDQELLLRAAPVSRYACVPDVVLAYRQGRFDLRKTLLARRQLLAAQAGIFYRAGEWKKLLLVSLFFGAKVAVDLLAALPGGQRFFFARMAHAVPVESATLLRKLLSGHGR